MSKLALAMIFGNEEGTIQRFVESFAPCVQVIFACRAIGESVADSTIDILTACCKTQGIELHISEYFNRGTDGFPHVDHFGDARQSVWAEAEKSDATHLMWADIDDVLQHGADFAIRMACRESNEDVLICPYYVRGSKQIVHRERIVRNEGFSFWDGALHESLKFRRDVKYRLIVAGIFLHMPSPTRTTSAPRNKAILQSQVKDTARNFFYLAQEAFEAGNVSDVQKWGKLALIAPGLESIMRYETLLNLAQVETVPEEARKMASRAYMEMPDRREALALMANFHIIDGRYEEAHKMAKVMMQIPIPTKTYWSLNRDWYYWKGFYLFTQCLRLTGRGEDALKLENDRFREGGSKISLLHATRGRPMQALATRELWISLANNPAKIEHVFVYDRDDQESIRWLSSMRHQIIFGLDNGGCVEAWNAAAESSQGQILIQVSDDFIPPQGWDDLVIERMGDLSKPSVLAVSDGHRTDRLLCMAILTRARYEAQGFMFHHRFKSVYSDNYFTEMAYKDGVVIEARDLVFYHNHPAFTGEPLDATYQESNSPERYSEGKAIYDELMGTKFEDVPCKLCDGSGLHDESFAESQSVVLKCHACDGSGKVKQEVKCPQ